MPARKIPPADKKVAAKARQVLEWAQRRVRDGADWVELSNALFGLGGQATQTFPTEAKRTAFCKTAEYKRILALMDRLPAPPGSLRGEPA